MLPVVQALSRLPLTTLSLWLSWHTDEEIECLSTFLPLSSLQDLKLGTLTPKQLQLVVDALPSSSYLTSLEFDTRSFNLCQHESSHLALFSALTRARPRSSLRSLTVGNGSFRLSVLQTCLNKIPETQLTRLKLDAPIVYCDIDGFDPTIAMHDENYKRVDQWHDLGDLLDWDTRFPQIKDKFCLLLNW
jgi:hypothetical protein